MRWTAQVAHVARKDLSRYGWLVAALSIGIMVVVVEVLTMRSFATAPSSLIVVLGMVFTVGLFVQEDSPTRVDAFWATRPLHPLAVFTAKLGVVAALLFIGLAGQWVILRAHAAPGTAVTSALGAATLWTADWLLLAMVIAVLTADLRAYVLGLIGVVVGRWMLAGALLVWQEWRHGPAAAQALTGGVTPWAEALVCLAWAAFAAHQYRTRNVRRGWMLAIALIVASGVLYQTAPRKTVADEVLGTEPDAAFAVRIEDVDVEPLHDGRALLRARFDMDDVPPNHRVSIAGMRVQLRGPDGSVLSDGAGRWRMRVTLTDPEPALEGVDRWLSRDPRAVDAPSPWFVVADLSADEARAFAGGEVVLRVTGTATLDRPDPVVSVPLESRDITAEAGVRLRIAELHREGWDIRIEARLSSVGPSTTAAHDRFSRDPADRFVLVNRATGEALTLRETGRSWSYHGPVLPSATTVIGSMSLETEWGTSHPPTIDADAWFQDAELVLLRWTTVGVREIEGRRWALGVGR